MDLIDEIEKLLIEDCIKDFVSILTKEYNHDVFSEENILEIRYKIDSFLNNLSDKYTYDYHMYIGYDSIPYSYSIKFKFNIQRRGLYGFLG